MKKFYILSAAMLSLGMTAPAWSADETAEMKSKTTMEKDADGTYHKKTTRSAESTDSAGTTTKSETKIDDKNDADGNGEKKVITETSTDPKGLMNKSKTKETDSIKYKDGEIEKKHQKKVDGKTVEENTSTTKN